jgi:hypothetical protein
MSDRWYSNSVGSAFNSRSSSLKNEPEAPAAQQKRCNRVYSASFCLPDHDGAGSQERAAHSLLLGKAPVNGFYAVKVKTT